MPMDRARRKKVGDHNLGKADIGSLSDLWMGLLRADPSGGDYSSEVDAPDYGRINVTALFSAFDPDTGVATQTATIDFGVPANDWTGPGETLAFVAFFGAEEDGEPVYYEAIPQPRTALAGSAAVRWSAGKITIRHI